MKKAQSKRGSGKQLTASTLPATLALSSALFLMPGVTPQNAMAQKGTADGAQGKSSSSQSSAVFKFFRPNPISNGASVVGSYDGVIVFKSKNGKFFSIDSKTGDLKEYSSDYYIKFDGVERSKGSNMFIKFDATSQSYEKHRNNFSIVGCDASGNTIMKTSSGELFTLDPRTGDMKFVK